MGSPDETSIVKYESFSRERLIELTDKFHGQLLDPAEAQELQVMIKSSPVALEMYRDRLHYNRQRHQEHLAELPVAAAADSVDDLDAIKTEVLTGLGSLGSSSELEELRDDTPGRSDSDETDWEHMPSDSSQEDTIAVATQIASEQAEDPLHVDSRGTPRILSAMYFSIAICLIIGVAVYLLSTYKLAPQKPDIIQVTKMENVIWSLQSPSPEHETMKLGENYYMYEGLLQLHTPQGVMLIFKGRCEFQLLANGMVLERGVVTVNVPENGHFKINHSFGVVDASGLVGVQVSGRKGRLVVFEGYSEAAIPEYLDQTSTITIHESVHSDMVLRWHVPEQAKKVEMEKYLLTPVRRKKFWGQVFPVFGKDHAARSIEIPVKTTKQKKRSKRANGVLETN